MARNYVQGKDYRLAGSGVAATDTSIVLTSMQLPNSNANIAMADFGAIGFATIEPETDREENISFTGITQNVNGTATLTGVTRGLTFVSPSTVDTNLRKSHSGGTVIRISNSVQFYENLANKYNSETIKGAWTFNATADGANPVIDDPDFVPSDDDYIVKKYAVEQLPNDPAFQTAVNNFITASPLEVEENGVSVETGVNKINILSNSPIVTNPVSGEVEIDMTGFGSGLGGGGGSSSKPMTFAITSAGSGTLNPTTGYQDREAIAFGAGNANFYLQDATGYIQRRDTTADWVDADITSGHALIGNALYLLLRNTGGAPEARIYKYDASDLSLGGTQMTISGITLTYNTNLAMTSNGTKLYVNFAAGTTANAHEIAGFTVSGTTATYVSTVTCGASGTPFTNSFAVTSVENYYGFASGVLTQYGNTGTLTYTSSASGASGAIINWDDTLYVGESDNGLCIKLYLPDTEIAPTGSASEKKVGVGEVSDINWFNIQIPFTDTSVWGGSLDTVAYSKFTPTQSVYVTDNIGADTFLPDFDGANEALLFSTTKQVIFQQLVKTNNAGANNFQSGVGFQATNVGGNAWSDSQGDNTTEGVGFVRRDSDGQWYARTCNGTNHKETAITISDGKHVFRCEYDPGNADPRARFYVDGLLLATHTASGSGYLPTAFGGGIGFASGNGSAGGSLGISSIGIPSFAVEI